ncbi:MAG: long-chain fatty acid--CoA ligase [Xanthobacteraceae bacterium]|nr:MAG: long-chain fatty acid--CoA ligase [Xanthobacteraceae bacterium]
MKDQDFGALPKVHATVVHMLAEAAATSPSATALVLGERRLTYAQYLDRVAALAAELVDLGARGERVALVCANSLDIPIAIFGIHAAGAQAVPINPSYTARELGHILTDAAPVVCIYDEEVASVVEPLVRECGIRHSIKVGGTKGRRLWDSFSEPTRRLPEPLPAASDLATLQYTGGTTGLPKGVNITHGQMSVNISQREAALPTRADDESILCMMPLFHVFAVAMGLHLAVYCRGKLVIVARYKPEVVLDLVARERITRFPAGPTVFIGLLNHDDFERTDFSSVRCSYSGSAPLPEETLREWERRVGSPILEGFGQTEAGPVLTYIRDRGPYKPGSVGPALPLTEIRIVDVETGTLVLPIGAKGEVSARGPQIMSSYRNRPSETAEALRDGWLHTGDIGELDDDGYLYIRDRKKDMAIVGGYNVYPREVEEVLYTHPAVKEAAAAGVPDSYYGETLSAYVVTKEGANVTVDELVEFCKANLTRYKVPSRLILVNELPRTTIGKIDKNELRARLSREA